MHYYFSEFSFSGGETLQVEPAQLLILVGPNNCGKSRALREIELAWRNAPVSGLRVITSASAIYSHDWDEFDTWVRENYSVKDDAGRFRYSSISVDVHFGSSPRTADWTVHGQFQKFVISRLSTESRLEATKAPTRVDPFSDRPQHFVHRMQMDANLMERMQREVREAFGLDLELDYNSGTNIPLVVGELPEMEKGWDRVHPDYARAIREQTRPLEMVGDGVRSYIATIGAVLSESQPVLLIDEPEAFLHPPQARRLGKLLGGLASERKRQIIVATHSSDIVQGALSSSGRIAVCRLEREGLRPGASVNHAYQLDPDRLRSLWEKPLLRSSHTIDGIFHRGVVVCESDSDARFYEALLTRLEEWGKLLEPADVHFVHGGGKAELGTLARSYRELHVPVAVIADFDLLRNEGDVRRLVEALGGDFAGFARDYKIASSALAGLGAIRTEEEALKTVEQLVTDIRNRVPNESGHRLTGADRRAIKDTLTETQEWGEAKRYGLRRLRGEQRQAGERLLNRLKELGLFIVPSGELESWDETLPAGRKEVWILEALEKTSDPKSFPAAALFVERVAAHLGLGQLQLSELAEGGSQS